MNRSALLVALAAAVTAAIVVLAAIVPTRADDASGSPTAAGGSDAGFKNVKVLTHVKTKAEMRQLMKAQAASLGVKCTHCHVAGKFELDDKKEKLVARDMLRMVQDLNATVFKDSEDKPAITCWTCHRGAADVERDVPQSAFDKIDMQQ